MIATSVYGYLEPYLPSQVVYAISMAVFIFEKFFLPKFYDLYSHASLDPKSLVPFLISAIALYLSIVSIYHAFKAALRMIWFLMKWSVLLVIVWFILGLLNEASGKSDGGQTRSNLFQSYQNSALSWWNGGAWSMANLNPQNFLGPLQLVFGQSVISFFEPMLNHFQPQNPAGGFFSPGKSSRALRIHPLNRELEMAMHKAREQLSQTTTTLKSPMHVTSSTESGLKPFKHLCNLSCAKPRTAGLEVRSRKMENLDKPKIGDSFVHFSRKGSLEFILSSINLQEETLSPLIFVIILRAFRLNVCI